MNTDTIDQPVRKYWLVEYFDGRPCTTVYTQKLALDAFARPEVRSITLQFPIAGSGS